jgi:hypothetical protein
MPGNGANAPKCCSNNNNTTHFHPIPCRL